MKRLFLLIILAGLAYVAYDEYQRWQAAKTYTAPQNLADVPHWEDIVPRSPGRESSADSQDAPATFYPDPVVPSAAGRDSWSEGGGLFGRIQSFVKTINDGVSFFFFGASSSVAEKPSAATKVDQLQRLDAAAVTVSGTASGAGSGGSGFVLAYQGRKYIATNIHVLEGEARTEARLAWSTGPRVTPHGNRNPRLARSRIAFSSFDPGRPPTYLGLMEKVPLPRITNRDGNELKVGTEMLVSETRDIVLLPVETEIEPLELSDSPPVRGAPVLIVANPEAAGVLHALKGSVQAAGPDNLEIAVQGGKLVPGMSGSAIVSAATGKVVGIVTYSLLASKFDPAQAVSARLDGRWPQDSAPAVRDFGYRLDNAIDYDKVSWPRFCREIGIIHALRERTLNVLLATEVPLRMARSQEFAGYEIQPDFNSTVSSLYNSHLRSLATIARSDDAADRQARWDSYRRQLESALLSSWSQLSGLLGDSQPVRTPYLQRALRDEVERESNLATTYLRLQAGKIPPRMN
jgi:S1-C subfamily serine protease